VRAGGERRKDEGKSRANAHKELRQPRNEKLFGNQSGKETKRKTRRVPGGGVGVIVFLESGKKLKEPFVGRKRDEICL